MSPSSWLPPFSRAPRWTVALIAAALAAGCSKRQTAPPPPPPPPQQTFQPGGPLSAWMACGPWPVAEAESLAREALSIDFLTSIGGEAAADPSPDTRCRWGLSELSFRLVGTDEDGIDLGLHNAGVEGVLYFATRITSDAPRRAFFHIQARQGLRAWCNGREVFIANDTKENARFRAFEAMLEPGVNRLLLKVVVGKSPGRVQITMADESGHRHALAAAAIRKTDPGIVRAAMEQSGDAGETLSLRCQFPFATLGAFDDIAANWKVSSLDGTVEWQGSVPMGDAAEATLSPVEGFHRIRLEVAGLLAEPIVVERTILTSKDPGALQSNMVARAQALIANPASSAYVGRIAEALDDLRAKKEDKSPLATLQDRIREAESNPLPTLRGRIAWSFRSTIDNSGQPFRLGIPEAYRPDYRHPLHVRVTRDALEADDPSLAELFRDAFVLWPSRRAIESGARGIGARDIIDAIDFVVRHWSIDDRRIYISGDGPTGAAAWRIAARYPDRFSALRIAGSPAPPTPIENLSRVPLFSTHAEEDSKVPWWLSRAPLTALSRIGGFAVAHDIIQEDGDGSKMRQEIGPGVHWERSQRPAMPIERIQFVAADASSSGGYWANVLEWHDGAEPARWLARCSRDNGLFLDAKNVAVLRIDLSRAPLDLQRPIRITVNGRRQGIADPPFGDSLYLSISGEFLRVTGRPPFIKRLPYRPGDPAVLVETAPLLIVRGTGGTDEFRASARVAAERLSRMTAPQLGPTPNLPKDPIWGVREDKGLTDAEIAGYHLFLLGGPEQNSVVARMATNLPIKCEADRITTPGGHSLPLATRAWWLHYPNPLAPNREIFIAACADPAFFNTGMPAPSAIARHSPLPDFMMWTADGRTLATAGFFGAGWEWVARHRRGVLPETLCSQSGWLEFQAAAIARAGAAEFSVLDRRNEASVYLFVPGETTWADALACVGDAPIWRFTVTNRDLMRIQDGSGEPGEDRTDLRLHPDPGPDGERRGRARIVTADADLATRLLRAMGPRVEEADFAGDGVRQAVEWAIDAAPGQVP